jgi:hypothetical protein
MTTEEILEMAEKVYGECDWHDSALAHLEQFAELVEEKTVENKLGCGCSECGVNGGHAFYCVACAEKFVKNEWVWLTDKEVDECLQGLPTQTIDVYARRIEIKIKEKNT